MERTLIIEGMSCQHCKMAVEKALSQLEEVSSVNVDLEGKKAVVDVDNVSDEKLKKVVNDAGYQVISIE